MNFFWNKKKSGADIAKDRLMISIMADRGACNPKFLDKMKEEMIKVIKKYIDVKDIKIIKDLDNDKIEALSIDIELNSRD